MADKVKQKRRTLKIRPNLVAKKQVDDTNYEYEFTRLLQIWCHVYRQIFGRPCIDPYDITGKDLVREFKACKYEIKYLKIQRNFFVGLFIFTVIAVGAGFIYAYYFM